MRIVLCLVLLGTCAFAQTLKPEHQLARDILKELVDTDTVAEHGSTRKAAEALAKRFRTAGFPKEDVIVTGPAGPHANLVVRLRGKDPNAKPVLLMAHIDVVEAKKSDWSTDPFQLIEKDGFFYGRGSGDDKSGVTVIATNLLRLKKEGFVPKRDVYALFTCDEETTATNGIVALIKQIPAVRNAEFAINADGGGGLLVEGKRTVFGIQTSEKVYADFELTARDAGGHSSLPRPDDNPIYRLSAAMLKLRDFQFPVHLNDTTRAMLTELANFQPAQTAADLRAMAAGKADDAAILRLTKVPEANSLMRTTCVATMANAGHAPNALPQSATVNVNCRILPNDDVNKIDDLILQVIGDPGIKLKAATEPKPSPPSAVDSAAYKLIADTVKRSFPEVSIVPEMSAGATDGLYLRNVGVPVYGAMSLFGELGENRAHGKDERIQVQSFYDSVDHWHQMIKAAGNQ
jgi:acetylornithine deacetylase/succinyl-diaminopimelate desuccinylase-like protein